MRPYNFTHILSSTKAVCISSLNSLLFIIACNCELSHLYFNCTYSLKSLTF